MQSHRILSGLTIFVMVVLVAAGYFLVAQPQLAAASAASLQLASVQSQIAGSQTSIVQLKSEQKSLPDLKKTLATLRLSIPSTIDGSSYINGLNSLASAAGVTITGIKLSDAQAYAPPAGSAVATAPAGAAASPTPTPTPTDTSSAAPAPVATGWVPPTDPLITGANFVAVPVTVATTGGYAHTLEFIKGLQTGTRLFLVTGFTSARNADNPDNVTAGINGYIYVILDPKADIASTTATASPTPTATPTPSVTPSPSGTATPTPTQSPTPTRKP